MFATRSPIVLRKVDGRLEACRHFATNLIASIGPAPSLMGALGAFVFALIVPLVAVAVLAATVMALTHPHAALAGLSLATAPAIVPAPRKGVTLTSKNRQAQELRAQAQTKLDELSDITKEMTHEEVLKRQAEIKGLLERANTIAEFTGDDEVRRQGADPADPFHPSQLVPADEPGAPKQPRRELVLREGETRMGRKMAEFANRIIDEFGDVRSFLNTVVAGAQPDRAFTDAQKALITENKTLLRQIIGTTGDASGGEFLLPLTQVQTIFSLANVQQGLLQRARAYNVPGRSLRIPYLKQTGEAASSTLNRPMAGQIANITIVGENTTAPARTPEFGQRLLNIFKYAAVTQVGNETLADDFTGELPQEFINAVGQQTLNKVNEDITISGSDGTGATTPAGALLAAQAYNIAVSRNTPSEILPVDLFAMYAQHTHGPNSVWLASRRTVQQLYNMSLTSASLVTFLRDLRGLPEMVILGYPVVLTDLLNTVGTTGDIALVNPDFYAFALRQALTVESSRDFAFTTDLTTYKFIVRAGGLPINTGTYAYKYATSNLVDQHSPFVYLN